MSGLCQAQGNVKKKLFRCRQRFGHRETIEIRKNLLESWRSVIIKLLQRPHVTALAQQIPVFLVFQASPIPNIGLEIIEALGTFRHTTLLIAGTAAASRPKSQVLCTFAYCNRFACIFVSAAPRSEAHTTELNSSH